MNIDAPKMIAMATAAAKNAYAPYSKFSVGCCVVSESGEHFVGCNVENASYSLTVCAEASAICQMVAAGQKRVRAMVLLSLSDEPCQPCGACRQRLYEFSDADTQLMICAGQNKPQQVRTYAMDDLLPRAFVLNEQEQK